MAPIVTTIIAGVVAGTAASFVMERYQGLTAHLFGQDKSVDDPATVKAADSAKATVGAKPVTQKRRGEAGELVHYATGIVLGLNYALLVLHWPVAAIGFGAAFGVVVAILLDDIAVPAFGWGPWPWQVGAGTHAYSVTAHVVFGLVLEAVRRLVSIVIG